ncbi:hypothetical protein JST97_23140 [bacterium]|nr:hypothetical protein [bacterium]
MFDVASGECELVDFLLTRFDPIDLKTKIKFDPSANVDEQFAPSKEPEPAPLIVSQPEPERQPISLELNLNRPLPSNPEEAVATSSEDGYRTSATSPEVDQNDSMESGDEEQSSEAEDASSEPVRPTSMGPDWLTLMEEFNKARQRYHEEVAVEKKPDETP